MKIVINVFRVINFVTLGSKIEDFLGMIYTIKTKHVEVLKGHILLIYIVHFLDKHGKTLCYIFR
jgi:hypothetical protein